MNPIHIRESQDSTGLGCDMHSLRLHLPQEGDTAAAKVGQVFSPRVTHQQSAPASFMTGNFCSLSY